MPQPEEYAPGSGFTEGELQFASFWVRNRQAVHRAIVAALITVNAVCWGYALWGILDAYAISYPVESRIMQDIAENQFIAQQLESNRPKSILPGTVQVFEGTGERMDITVPLHNPNERWYAEFTYRFIVSGEQTPVRSGFILPKQSSMIGEFGFTPQTKGTRLATLSVDHIQWKRVDPSVVGDDVQKWMADRDAFQISDMTFQPPTIASGPSRSSFTFTNPTGFGYWTVGLYLTLLRGDSSVATTYLSLDRVKPNDRRTVTVDWFEPLSGVTDTRVVPVVNFFDRSAYLPSTEF